MVEIKRSVVVTGAASGIGRAVAELFLNRGFGVVAVDRSVDGLLWAEDETNVITVAGDVAVAETNEAMVAAALDQFGRLDVAVLNAGIAGGLGFESEGSMERLDTMLGVNVRGVALGIRYAAPAMRASGGGSIVATASTSGLRGDPRNWAYNASKAAVINMVRAAALDYGAQGIRVNAVAPGPTETAISERLTADPVQKAAMARRIPMQRWGLPEELAEAIWFLASPAASFITGVTLPVDGGLSANANHFDLPASGGGPLDATRL
jgi:meso-butanediol dehydrogenase / (S,S)-butanediol dehydrogenase / diacetyl reductase